MNGLPIPGVPQVVDRGDGSTYRARKPPEAIPVHLCGFGPGVLVLRCHDTIVAALALADLPHDLEADALNLAGEPIWVRWVPDDYDEPANGCGSYERELRGTAGATPAVLFAQPNPSKGSTV